jgi:P4 family phage/plasmid primase-like protien
MPPDASSWCAGETQAEEFREYLNRLTGGEAVASSKVAAEHVTEDLLARRLIDRHGERLRYVEAWGRWLVWDGKRWSDDQTRYVIELARQLCREFGVLEPKLQARLGRAGTIEAVERLARSDRRVAVAPDVWDSGPYLLNTPDGVLDFRSGELRPHDPAFYCRKITGAGMGDDCPLWRAFLRRITDGDAELERYLQRMAGYALTGLTNEHAFFLLFGHGGNGKSVFLSTLATAWGDYCTKAPADVFLASTGDRHPTELAALHGARLVIASEIEPGRRWNESRLKELTGGDKISARFMRRDFFEFQPAFKLVIASNHKPRIRTVSEAMRRRLHLVPFDVTIPAQERDPLLSEKLRGELPGILTWAVEGTAEWLAGGLRPPEAVQAHTAEYFDAEDRIAEWLEQQCECYPAYATRGADLLADYRQWLEQQGEGSISRTAFYEALAAKGFKTEIRRKVVWVLGLALADGRRCIDEERED